MFIVSAIFINVFLLVNQVGKHGLIIEFTDPDYNIRRSATYLPEVAGHEGECFCLSSI